MSFAQGFEIEFAYWISPDNVQFPLFGGRRALMRFAGLGMADIRYITDSGPFVNGERIRGFRAETRVIDFQLFERACSRQERWDNLGDMDAIMRPNRGDIGKILIILPDFTEREIDAKILVGPRGEWQGDSSLQAWDVDENLRFIAPFPIWRDTTLQTETFTVSPADSCLPTCLPVCLGVGFINTSVLITYPGTWESRPTIVITGPASGPIISNLTTGEEIKMIYDIAAGETVTIEITPDNALVYNNSGQDLIGTIEDTNDLSVFSIDPEGVDVPGGVNEINVSASGAIAGTTAVELQYYDQYIGVPK